MTKKGNDSVKQEFIQIKLHKKTFDTMRFYFYDSDSRYPDRAIVKIKDDDYLKLKSKLDLDYKKFGESYKEYIIFTKILDTFDIPYDVEFHDVPW